MFNAGLTYVRQFDRDLWILSIGWFVSSLGFATSIPFIAIYFHATLGMSMSQIGLFFGAMAIVRSVSQAAGGEISDRVERRFLLIHSQLFRTGAFVMLALAIYFHWGFIVIAIALMINAVSGAVFQPVANAVVSDILPKSKRLDGYAITRSAGNLGWAAGPAIGGFLAGHSYGLLFVISGVITLISGAIFLFFFHPPRAASMQERFKLRDIVAVRDDPHLARHAVLTFTLYLVVAQLMAPFSVYAVEMSGISENQLGLLYTINGLIVVALQVPVTQLMKKVRLTNQLALGAFVYFVGYALVGTFVGFGYFVVAIVIVTIAEVIMSPPSLLLASRLAPEGRMGRYMGVFGFCVASGWSFGPLYGGLILDYLGHNSSLAWIVISSLALVAGSGYLWLKRSLPDEFNK